VAGAALDLLRHCYTETGRPSTVYLCGCDFGGNYYFKRDPITGEQYRCSTVGVWGQKRCMDTLIDQCIKIGMRVLTLSETNLAVNRAD
jgi:hypothetical protein